MDAEPKKRWRVLNEFIKEIVAALKQDKTKPYDTVAKVVRVDEKTAYVHIDGGAEETPAQMTINCKTGDSVKIRVSGGKAWLTGNITAPPTDDTVAKKEISNVKKTYQKFKSKITDDLNEREKEINKFKSKTAESFNAQEEEIKKAYRAATNFIKYVDDVGLIVGDMRDDELTGNTLIDANGTAIRDGTNELVRFGITNIKILNDYGEVMYDGVGSTVQSENNIVVSTQQTKDANDTSKGGKSSLEMYYNPDTDTVGTVLAVRKGTSYADLYEKQGYGLYLECCNKKETPYTNAFLYSNTLSLQGDKNTQLSGEYVGIGYGEGIECVSSDVQCVLGKNKKIWSGALYMNEGQTVSIEALVSKQLTGIVLAWSHYDTSKGKADDWGWNFFFVPKQHVIWKNGFGIQMANPYSGMNKYVYVYDDKITGNAKNVNTGTENGISYANKNYVLRCVVGV